MYRAGVILMIGAGAVCHGSFPVADGAAAEAVDGLAVAAEALAGLVAEALEAAARAAAGSLNYFHNIYSLKFSANLNIPLKDATVPMPVMH